MRYLVGLFSLFILSPLGCIESSVKPIDQRSVTFSERYRPQFHFSPQINWMNDPNGLVFHKGQYHLFYQYYPDSTVWGPMHWGHATSRDLSHWEHQPVALYPDSLGYIFSGSAVIDHQNTSGLGTKENPAMVAVFTYHNMDGERAGRTDFQTQGIAYSFDDGLTWEKYKDNPVIDNPSKRDFRDPKVFWHEASQKWILVLVAGDHAQIYQSVNLMDWTFASSFGHNQGAHGGVWECPDLFALTTDQGMQKWILSVSINPGGANGGSATQYFVGEFDGTTFSTDQKDIKWLDQGRDNYAGVTYNDAPNNDRVLIGWMSNWDYAQVTPTSPWRSSMTLPRRLHLNLEDSNYFLVQTPILDSSIMSNIRSIGTKILNNGLRLPVERSKIEFELDLSENTVFELYNEQERFIFSVQGSTGEMIVDRRASGKINFSEKFAPGLQQVQYEPQKRNAGVAVFCDTSSIEIFVDSGRYVFTNQVFPKQPYTHLKITTDGPMSDEIIFTELNSIWHEQ